MEKAKGCRWWNLIRNEGGERYVEPEGGIVDESEWGAVVGGKMGEPSRDGFELSRW